MPERRRAQTSERETRRRQKSQSPPATAVHIFLHVRYAEWFLRSSCWANGRPGGSTILRSLIALATSEEVEKRFAGPLRIFLRQIVPAVDREAVNIACPFAPSIQRALSIAGNAARAPDRKH